MPLHTQTAKTSVSLLAILFRHHPEWWDGVNPHVGPWGPLARFERVALNPQPLPPKVRFAMDIRYGLTQIADAVVTASAAGLDVGTMLDDVEGELCPSPPPPFPWPHRFPVPVPPGEPYPIDVEDVTPLVQAHAAVVFQSYADRIADDTLRNGFAALADRCANAALQQQEVA
jgi:hypothetical protein